MKNKKGFTLVELLAIIVILAVIMVIAVPQILNVVNGSKDSAWKSNVSMIQRGIVKNSKLLNPETGAYDYSIDKICSNPSLLSKVVKVEDTDIKCSGNVFTLTGKGQFAGKSATISCSQTKCFISIKKEAEPVLAAGLYDNQGNMLANWYDLVHVYGMYLDWDSSWGDDYGTIVTKEKVVDGLLYVYLDEDDIGNMDTETTGVTTAGWYHDPSGPFKDNTMPEPSHPEAVQYIYISQEIYEEALARDIELEGIDGVGWYYLLYESSNSSSSTSGIGQIGGGIYTWHKDNTLPIPSTDVSKYEYLSAEAANQGALPGANEPGWWYFKKTDGKLIKNDSIPAPVAVQRKKPSDLFATDNTLKKGTKLVISAYSDTIEKNTFANCTTLREIVIGEGITTVEFGAFAGCSNLEKVYISSSVRTLDAYVFRDCDLLNSLVFEDPSNWKYKYGNESEMSLLSESILSNDSGAAEWFMNNARACKFSKDFNEANIVDSTNCWPR